MKYPFLTALVIVVAVLLVAFVVRKTQSEKPENIAWVSNTASLRRLPAFFHAQKTMRIAVTVAGVSLVVCLVSLAVVAGAPVDRKVENATLAQRDLVVCLDASGSMLPYNGQILEQMEEMVDSFAGERISLQLWSGQTVVKFPLTDDYELATNVLNEAAGIMRRGYLAEEDDYVLVTPELADYLAGVETVGESQISSLVGDGLASCVLGFDHRDEERSRTIIFATDNEVQGPQIYTLQEAVKFASDQNVSLIGLYPAREGVLTTEGEELRRVVEAAEGSFYQANNPDTIDGIIDNIESQQLTQTDGSREVVETHRPQTALKWALWSGLVALVSMAWRQL